MQKHEYMSRSIQFFRICLAASALTFFISVDDASAKPPAQEKLKPVFADSFDRVEEDDSKEQVGKGWRTNSKKRAKGAKQVDLNEGVLSVSISDQADHAVTVVHDESFKNCKISLRFKLGAKDSLGVNFNDKMLKTTHAGHVCATKITLNRLWISDDKLGRFEINRYKRKKAGAKLAEIKKEVAPYEMSQKIALKPDTWHTLVVIIEGDIMTTIVNDKIKLTHQSKGFDHPTKSNFAFSVPRKVQIDDVKMWTWK